MSCAFYGTVWKIFAKCPSILIIDAELKWQLIKSICRNFVHKADTIKISIINKAM